MPTVFADIVSAGAISFNDDGNKPVGAVVWGLDSMLGWGGTSKLISSSTPKGAWGDGDIFGSYFSSSGRNMTLGGYCWASDRAQAEQLKDLLIGDAFPINSDIVLTRQEPIPKTVTVRVTDEISFEMVGSDKFRWVVPVSSESPYKFSVTESSYGPVGAAGSSLGGFSFPLSMPLEFVGSSGIDANLLAVVNLGTAPSYARLQLTGPLVSGAWRVSNETTGEYIGYHLSASAGDIVIIDMEGQYATVNGEISSASLFGDFWPLKPRSTNMLKLFTSSDPSTSLSATARSAWR